MSARKWKEPFSVEKPIKKPIFLVTEFCECGDPDGFFHSVTLISGRSLKDYLQNNRVDVEGKLQFSLGSSCGLEYIHFKGLIHMDLATRNILVSADKTVSRIRGCLV